MTFILQQDLNGDGVIGFEEVCGCVLLSVLSLYAVHSLSLYGVT
jgi:hypothetical protein